MASSSKRTHGKTQATQVPITLSKGPGGNEGVGQAMGRIVDQYFYGPKRLLGEFEKLRNCGGLTQVSFPGLGLSTLAPDRPDDLRGRPRLGVKVQCFPGPAGFHFAFSLVRQCGRLPEIVDKYACPLGCERLGGRAPIPCGLFPPVIQTTLPFNWGSIILWLPTLSQVFEYRLERQVRLARPLLECCQVFRILPQAQPHGVIDDLGNRSAQSRQP